jgi:hypothetical protein
LYILGNEFVATDTIMAMSTALGKSLFRKTPNKAPIKIIGITIKAML